MHVVLVVDSRSVLNIETFSKASHSPLTTFFGHKTSGTLICGLYGWLDEEEEETADEIADLILIELAIIF